jgi:hypothetical protein
MIGKRGTRRKGRGGAPRQRLIATQMIRFPYRRSARDLAFYCIAFPVIYGSTTRLLGTPAFAFSNMDEVGVACARNQQPLNDFRIADTRPNSRARTNSRSMISIRMRILAFHLTAEDREIDIVVR